MLEIITALTVGKCNDDAHHDIHKLYGKLGIIYEKQLDQNRVGFRRSSLDEWIEVCVCAHNALGCHSAIKETDPAICNNTDGPRWYYVK